MTRRVPAAEGISQWGRDPVTLAILLLCAAWLALPWSLLAIAAVVILLLVGGGPRSPVLRWLSVAIASCGVLAASLALQWSGDGAPTAVANRVHETLVGIRAQAERIAASSRLEGLPSSNGSTGFAQLQAVLQDESGSPSTVLLVDGDGVAEAWAGGGLRHPLPESDLPPRGWLILESFTATTVAWIEPLGNDGARIVVGRSESALALPADWGPSCHVQRHCANANQEFREGRVWRIGLGTANRTAQPDSLAPPGDGVVRASVGEFTLSLRRSEVNRLSDRVGIHVLVLMLVLALLMVDIGVRLSDRIARKGPWALGAMAGPLVVALAAVGVGLGCAAIAPEQAGLLALQVVGLHALTVGGLAAAARAAGPATVGLVTLSCVFTMASAWAAFVVADDQTLVEPGVVALPSAPVLLSMLLAHLTLAVGLALSLHRGPAPRPSRYTVLGLAILVAVVAQPFWLALAGVLLAALTLPRSRRVGAARVLIVLVLSGGGNGLIWALLQERETDSRMLDSLVDDESPFAGPGRWRVDSRLERHFESIDIPVASLGLEATGGWADDLALFLWATSPLNDLDGPSAIRVREGSRSAFFGYGLQQSAGEQEPFLEQGNTPVRREWIREALMRGRSILGSGRDGPIEVEWFALPLPSGPRERARSLVYRFLLGEPSLRRVWFPNARLTLGPWEGQPMLELGALANDREPRRNSSPAAGRKGRALSDGLQPRLGRVQRIERWFEESFVLAELQWRRDGPLQLILRGVRMASSSLVVLMFGGTAVGLLVLLARGRPLSLALGPFSRRLMLVFSVFTVVPIVLLTVLLLQSFSGRLRANQQEAGEQALQSAERMLGDYISSLEPGFSVTAALDADLLSWVSSIVRHEVNLYWRGAVLTASRPEIFSAGVLPNQIPGVIYANLEDHRNEVASRRNRTATETEYLELYREVEFPGVARSDLFVSVPLLAQEAETALTRRRMLAQALTLATALAFLLVFVALRFASAFTEPIRAIVGGTARIAEGAQELGLRPSIPELRELADAIDEMAGTIAAGRERLVREKQVVDTVIANIKSAVVSFGREDRVIMVNREAADLLHVRPGDSIEDVAATLESSDWRKLIERRPRVPERISIRLGESGEESNGSGEWTVQWLPIAGEGDPAALLVLEDVTEVLRAQRLEAWAEMARIIAHEVKNPLTPIRLSADHLRQVYESSPDRIGEVFDRCIDNILAQVEELRLIAGEFSIYSRIPSAERRPLDLVETVAQVSESYRAGSTDDLEFSVRLPAGPLICVHDPRLIGRVLRNLYENSIRACGARGRVDLQFDVVERSPEHGKRVGAWARIRVADSGPGVPPRDLERIFEPSFSASSGGTGLGLPISRGIIEEHGGEITARNRSREDAASDGMTGLEVSILLPLMERG